MVRTGLLVVLMAFSLFCPNDRSNQFVECALIWFPKADSEVAFADGIGPIRLCQIGPLVFGVGDPEPILCARVGELPLDAPLGITKGFSGAEHRKVQPFDMD